MTLRRQLIDLLTESPRSVSSLARELGLSRHNLEDELQHAIRSARAAGHQVIVLPARCKACGFEFDASRLSKPGKCPECRQSRILEPQIAVRQA
jgi:predicted Zn-ribbon and HTH transcriptional regulator